MNIIYNNFTRKILELCCRIASLVNPLIPKNKNKILFFESSAGFMNNYVLMKYMVHNDYDKKYKIYYFPDIRQECNLSDDYKNIKFSNNLGTAFFLFLISRIVFLDTGNMRIIPSKKQAVTYMDHGLPFKLDGLLRKGQDKKTDVPQDLVMPVNYFLSTSENFDKMNCETFSLSASQLIRCGRPRTDAFFDSKNYLDKVEINKEKYKKIIMWMTTWRVTKNGRTKATEDENWSDTNLPLLTNIEKIKEINDYLLEKNYLLVIKIHQSSVFDETSIQNLTNVKLLCDKDFVCSDVQIYDLLKDFDVLVTDYSSVFLDYLLTLKPMIFITDDIENFSRLHGFYFENPLDFMPGPKVNTYKELIEAFDAIDKNETEYKEARIKLRDFCHHFQDGKDSERLLQALNII